MISKAAQRPLPHAIRFRHRNLDRFACRGYAKHTPWCAIEFGVAKADRTERGKGCRRRIGRTEFLVAHAEMNFVSVICRVSRDFQVFVEFDEYQGLDLCRARIRDGMLAQFARDEIL